MLFYWFGESALYSQITLQVNSAGDDVTIPYTSGELRWAIDQANAYTGGTRTIKFNLPSSGSNPVVINVKAPLPAIVKPTIIDGTSQAGYQVGKPMVVIDGILILPPINPTGIQFSNTSFSKVLGMGIRNFHVALLFSFSNACEASYNVINQNSQSNITIYSSDECIIKGNFINTDVNLTRFSKNSEEGIFFSNDGRNGSAANTIGGILCGEGNTIGYTRSEGIDNNPSGANPGLNISNTYSGNLIFDNIYDGIELRGSPNAANINKANPIIEATGCTTRGTSRPNDIIELFGSTGPLNGKKNANQFIKTVVADNSGNWTASLDFIKYPFITATARDSRNNTSELSPAKAITPTNFSFAFPPNLCTGQPITFDNATTTCSGNVLFEWDFGDGSALSPKGVHTYALPGTYVVKLIIPGCPAQIITKTITVANCNLPCADCIESFAPEAGMYVLSAWVKEDTKNQNVLTYLKPQISIDFPSTNNPTGPFSSLSVGPFTAEGSIIDGWQRVDTTFNIPNSAKYINLRLECVSGDCFFDDIRIFPKNGSMKSYVYDPLTLRLVAELDERNYATLYEYDEEGKLIRVKKETEKGIMTIKENKDSTKKKQ